jgi:hypothetical protein
LVEKGQTGGKNQTWRILPSKDEGKSASTETESKHVLRLLFPPTQFEQPPQCVSNPASTVTELEHE